VVRAAVETHHVVPVQADRTLADHCGNLLPVCELCHDEVEGLSWHTLRERYGLTNEYPVGGWQFNSHPRGGLSKTPIWGYPGCQKSRSV